MKVQMSILLSLAVVSTARLSPDAQTKVELKRINDSPHMKKIRDDAAGSNMLVIGPIRREQKENMPTVYDCYFPPMINDPATPTCRPIASTSITIVPYPQIRQYQKGPLVFGLKFSDGTFEAAPGVNGQDWEPRMPSWWSEPHTQELEHEMIQQLEHERNHRTGAKSHDWMGHKMPSWWVEPHTQEIEHEAVQRMINHQTGAKSQDVTGRVSEMPQERVPTDDTGRPARRIDADTLHFTLKAGEMGYFTDSCGTAYPGAKPGLEQVGSFESADTGLVRCSTVDVTPSTMCGGLRYQQRFQAGYVNGGVGTTSVVNRVTGKIYTVTVTAT